MSTPTAARSKHFTLHQLGQGIHAAIAENGGWAICNAGLIDLGGQIVVFDAFISPKAARGMREAAFELFGRAPQLLVNSHYHNDHTWGNQVFAPDAQILSSARTRALIATEGAQELQWFSVNAAQQLATYRQKFENAPDEQERAQALLWIGEYEGVVEALPYLRVCLPGITFENHLEIHGDKYTAELITFEAGHTPSDTVLYLPKEGIVFMSDLLFVGFHPYLGECDPQRLIQALRELGRLEADRFIPGHGPIGGAGNLSLLIEYVEESLETAQRLVASGKTEAEQISALPIPEPYRHWGVPQFYHSNIRALCGRLSQNNPDAQGG